MVSPSKIYGPDYRAPLLDFPNNMEKVYIYMSAIFRIDKPAFFKYLRKTGLGTRNIALVPALRKKLF